MAKASILWLVGEYCSLVPKIAPDVLRKAAKSFTTEVCDMYRPNVLTCTMYLYKAHSYCLGTEVPRPSAGIVHTFHHTDSKV